MVRYKLPVKLSDPIGMVHYSPATMELLLIGRPYQKSSCGRLWIPVENSAKKPLSLVRFP
jgi:hypothetical protein